MKLYIAGPMRGFPHFNCYAFQEAAKQYRALGHEVWSPEEHTRTLYGNNIYTNSLDGDEDKAGIDGNLVFSDDIDTIINWADAIVMLKGWRKSRGARAEHAVAVAIYKTIMYDDPSERDDMYTAAVAAVVGDRPEEHSLMLGVGDGTCQRWSLSDTLLRKLRAELNARLDR